MMRLVRMALGLLLVPGPMVMAGQQAQPHTDQKPKQAAVTQASAQPSQAAKTTQKKSYHAARRRRSRAAARAKRAAYRPEYTENSVEVINGESTKKVVFHNDEIATASAKNLPATMKDAPAPIKVEVVNGASTDTQYFYDQGQDSAGSKQPVVVGIQSSDTHVVGGNKHPVVTGVTSSGSADAKSASSGGQPVTKSVAPRQKRPDYQPDTH